MLSPRSLQRSILVMGLMSVIRLAYADLAPVEEPMALDERVAKLERTVNSQSQMDLLSRVDSLQQEVQDLRGQIEVQGHTLSQLQAALAAQQSSKRADAANAGAQASTQTGSSTDEAATDTGSATDLNGNADDNTGATTDDSALTDPGEQKTYDAAYKLLRSKNYDRAVTALLDYIKRYPNGQNVGNAYYWLGAVYYVDSKLNDAKKAFTVVIKRFPEHPKAADAMLKLGYISASQGNVAAAKQTLERVKERYPNTASAKAADARLKQLGA